jgi:O-antigen/teichoic acid export membrane protein
MGAAIATMITYMVLMFVVFYFSVRENRFKLNFGFIIKTILGVVLLYLEGRYLLNTMESLYLKIFLYILNIVVLALFFYLILDKSDKNRLKEIFFKIRQKIGFRIKEKTG